jgi:hypothetical protein
LLVAVAILLAVTYSYTRQTRKAALLLQTSAERQVLPILVANLVPARPVGVELEIANVGLGAARNVRVTFGSTPIPGGWRNWEAPLIKAGQSYDLYVPTGPHTNEIALEYFRGRNFTLAVQMEYESVPGKHLREEQVLDVSNWVEQFVATRTLQDSSKLGAIDERAELLGDMAEGTKERALVPETQDEVERDAEELRRFVEQIRQRSRARPINA